MVVSGGVRDWVRLRVWAGGMSNESEMCWLELCCEVDWRGEARWW